MNLDHSCDPTFHLSTAACTSLPISNLACFFALSVILSKASIDPGDACRGSNSNKCPSFVGIATSAEKDRVTLEIGRGVCCCSGETYNGCVLGNRAVGYSELPAVFCVGNCEGLRECGVEEAVWKLFWESARELSLEVGASATERSLRTTILLFTRFNDDLPFVVVPCCDDPSAVSASVSACSTPLNQLIPN